MRVSAMVKGILVTDSTTNSSGSPEDRSHDLAAFLRELTALSERHGLAIGGCGCCNSPWVDAEMFKAGGEYRAENGEKLKWVTPNEQVKGPAARPVPLEPPVGRLPDEATKG